MWEQHMRLRLTIAMFGGLIGVIGSIAIFFVIEIGFLILARSLNVDATAIAESVKAPGNSWPSLENVLIDFSAGFLSGWIVAPPILRRLLSPQYKHTGFVTTGVLFGAAAGLLCSWLVALIVIVQLIISGIANAEAEDTLLWTKKLFGIFVSIAMVIFGSLAAIVGALSGSIAEWCYRWFRKDASSFDVAKL
jgi:hypothetical protein